MSESKGGAESPLAERTSSRHYAFLTFLTLLNIMNFVDRQLLSSFSNFIVPELGLTNTQFGLLTGLLFIFFYAFMGLFMGALGDMVHRPRLVAVGLALWSVLTAASGAARGFVSLALPRMFIGVGESVLTPTSMSMLGDRFPSSKLGLASGFYYMGVPIGVGASLLIAGYLGPAIGWRNCFYLLGAVGIVLAISMAFVKETPRGHQQSGNEIGEGPRQSVREIVATLWNCLSRSPALCYTMAGGVAVHFILGAAAFDQLWFVQERGFDRAYIAQMSGWLGVAGGVLGNLVGGFGSDWWQANRKSGRTMFLFWALLILMPIGLLYRMADPGSLLFWAGIFFGFFQLGIFYGPTFSTVQELAPAQIRSTAVAFYLLTLNFIGLGIGITASGYLIDVMMAANVNEPYTKVLIGFTLLSTLAIPLFYLSGKHFHRDRQRLFDVEKG
jgi:predicted MFS family arabinose efflux permease